MTSTSEEFFTQSDLARRFRVPTHRVRWVLRSRKIEPVHRAGGRAVYGTSALQQVQLGLQETGARWQPCPDRLSSVWVP